MGIVSFKKNLGEAYSPITQLAKYQGKDLQHIDLIIKELATAKNISFAREITAENISFAREIRYVLSLDINEPGVDIEKFRVEYGTLYKTDCYVAYSAYLKHGKSNMEKLIGIELLGGIIPIDSEQGYDCMLYYAKNTVRGIKYEVSVVGFRNIKLL